MEILASFGESISDEDSASHPLVANWPLNQDAGTELDHDKLNPDKSQ